MTREEIRTRNAQQNMSYPFTLVTISLFFSGFLFQTFPFYLLSLFILVSSSILYFKPRYILTKTPRFGLSILVVILFLAGLSAEVYLYGYNYSLHYLVLPAYFSLSPNKFYLSDGFVVFLPSIFGAISFFFFPLLYKLPYSGVYSSSYLPFTVVPTRALLFSIFCIVELRTTQTSIKSVQSISKSIKNAKRLYQYLIAKAFPPAISNELKQFQTVLPRVNFCSVVFLQIACVDSDILNRHLSQILIDFDTLAHSHQITKVKNIGPIFFGVFGIFKNDLSFPEMVFPSVAFAADCQKYLENLSENVTCPFHLEVGITSGVVLHGILSKSRFVWNVWGTPVNLASLLQTLHIQDIILTDEATALLYNNYISNNYVSIDPNLNVPFVPLRKIILNNIGSTIVYGFQPPQYKTTLPQDNPEGNDDFETSSVNSNQTIIPNGKFADLDFYDRPVECKDSIESSSPSDCHPKSPDKSNLNKGSKFESEPAPTCSFSFAKALCPHTNSAESQNTGNFPQKLSHPSTFYEHFSQFISKTHPCFRASKKPLQLKSSSKFQKLHCIGFLRWPVLSLLRYLKIVSSLSLSPSNHSFPPNSIQDDISLFMVLHFQDSVERSWWAFDLSFFLITVLISLVQHYLIKSFHVVSRKELIPRIAILFLFSSWIHALIMYFYFPYLSIFMLSLTISSSFRLFYRISTPTAYLLALFPFLSILVEVNSLWIHPRTTSMLDPFYLIHFVACCSFLASFTYFLLFDIETKETALMKSSSSSFALINRIFPPKIVSLIQNGCTRESLFQTHPHATWIDIDIVDFTSFCQKSTPQDIVFHLGKIFSLFDEISSKFGIQKAKTFGDAWIGIVGVFDDDISLSLNLRDNSSKLEKSSESKTPTPSQQALRSIEFARSCLEAIKKYSSIIESVDFQVRIVIHSGTVYSGVLGVDRISFDIWGSSLNILNHLERFCLPNQVIVTDPVAKILFEMEKTFNKSINQSFYIDPQPAVSDHRTHLSNESVLSLPKSYVVRFDL